MHKDKYIINENTMALIPVKGGCKIIENYITYFSIKMPIDIINESCKYYGSSFLGRCASTEYMTGIKYKCPIIISEIKSIIFFPTSSYKKTDCYWFNYNTIKKYYENSNYLLEIELLNGEKITLNLSKRIFNNQLFRSSRLESILRSKK